MAFNLGRNGINDGIWAGLGMIFRLKIKTTTTTKMDNAATKRNINLSVMLFKRVKIKESRYKMFS